MKVKNLFIIGIAAMVVACSPNRKNPPDEFQVVDRPSLVIPPNAELAPPRPGQTTPTPINPGQVAYEALFPGTKVKKPQRPVGGAAAMLNIIHQNAGKRIGPDVRSNAGDPDFDVVKKTLLLGELMDGKDFTHRPDNIVVSKQ